MGTTGGNRSIEITAGEVNRRFYCRRQSRLGKTGKITRVQGFRVLILAIVTRVNIANSPSDPN